jgi:hypothetical protein
MTAKTGQTGQWQHERWVKLAHGAAEPRQDSRDKTARTGQPTRTVGKYSQDRKERTGWPEYGRQTSGIGSHTERTRQDGQDLKARTGLRDNIKLKFSRISRFL